ncbi:MAG: hypothetical protein ACKVYV_18395 [Limisphaerales bacterium]
MSRKFKKRRVSRHIFVGLAGFAAAAQAQNQWIPIGGGVWNTVTNWTDGVFPNAAGASVLIGPSLLGLADITLGSPTIVGDLTLNSSHNIRILGSPANRLVFDRVPVDSEALLAAAGGGSHDVAVLEIADKLEINVAAGTGLSFSRQVIGNDARLRKTGEGTLDLTNTRLTLANLEGSLWQVEQGEVRFGGPLGSSATNLTSGRLRLSGGTVSFAASGGIVLPGSWEIAGAGGSINVENSITTIDVAAPVSGSGAFNKVGPGTLAFSPASSPPSGDPGAGPIGVNVLGGTLRFGQNYSSGTNLNVTVSPGATVTGDGRMGALSASGTVAPGMPGNALGTLTLTSLALQPGGLFEVQLGTGPTEVDTLVVTEGGVSLGGADLSLTLLAQPTALVEYVIVDKQSAGPVTGTFAQGATISADFGGFTYPFDILYNGGDGNDVVLFTLVPEPGAASLALLGAGVWLLGRRSGRRR